MCVLHIVSRDGRRSDQTSQSRNQRTGHHRFEHGGSFRSPELPFHERRFVIYSLRPIILSILSLSTCWITGIVVRMKKFPFLMHHKFVIIDEQILAFGSFNWTTQAVTGNFESVLVTNDQQTVKPFCREFQKLWDQMQIRSTEPA